MQSSHQNSMVASVETTTSARIDFKASDILQTSISSIPSEPSSFPILRLPSEVRLLIFEHVLTISASTILSQVGHAPHVHKPRHLPSLSLLLTSHQIYNESHTLPFHINNFDFYRWYNSNIHECRQFLRRLQPWQITHVRNLSLAVTEADLNGLGIDNALLDVCHSVGPNLHNLRIDINPIFDPDFDFYDTGTRFILKGLSVMQNLRSIVVTIGEKIPATEEGVESLEGRLVEALPTCGRVVVRSLGLEMQMQREKEKVIEEKMGKVGSRRGVLLEVAGIRA